MLTSGVPETAALHPDPAGDHVQRAQQDNERDVLRRFLRQHLDVGVAPPQRQVEHDGHGAERGHDRLVAVSLPAAGGDERPEGDGQQHRQEGQEAPQLEARPELGTAGHHARLCLSDEAKAR